MAETDTIYQLWKREMLVYFRQKSRIISSLFQPMLWLFIFGSGLGAASIAGVNYQQFLFPGIIAMSLIFTCLGSGISVIWDRDFGFLKETLVAPVSRVSILLGKVLGTVTIALFQTTLLFIIALIGGIPFNLGSLVLVYPIIFLLSVGLVSIGLTIATKLESMEGFHMVQSFLIMPMFFLSGALFPINQLPEPFRYIIFINPLSYGVDSLRAVMLGGSNFPIEISMFILVLIDILMLAYGSKAFSAHK